MTAPPAVPGLSVRPRKSESCGIYSGKFTPTIKCNIDDGGNITSLQCCEITDIDFKDKFTTPGLIDIQVNGFAGVDFHKRGLTAGEMDHALAHLAASGVTCVLPTLITASEKVLISRLETLDRAISESVLGPLMVPGYHIEGPFLSPKEGCSGAHPAIDMCPASKSLVTDLQDVSSRPILIMTVAPEQKGVFDLIPFLIERGIACAIGHTSASRHDIQAAISAGATLSTHLGNGLPHILNKNENPLFSQLGEDGLTASFIVDGIHVHPQSLQTYFRAKTLERSIIVTDAVSAAGKHLSPGFYDIGDVKIERHQDGTVRIPGSMYLAGSSVTMDQMVRNLINWYDFSIDDILLMARENPKPIVKGFVSDPSIGVPANLVHWHHRDGELHVRETSIGPWTIRPQY